MNLGIKNDVGINRGPDALLRMGRVCAEGWGQAPTVKWR